jgi:hypothetical protein
MTISASANTAPITNHTSRAVPSEVAKDKQPERTAERRRRLIRWVEARADDAAEVGQS